MSRLRFWYEQIMGVLRADPERVERAQQIYYEGRESR
jgi:hypothetical protein